MSKIPQSNLEKWARLYASNNDAASAHSLRRAIKSGDVGSHSWMKATYLLGTAEYYKRNRSEALALFEKIVRAISRNDDAKNFLNNDEQLLLFSALSDLCCSNGRFAEAIAFVGKAQKVDKAASLSTRDWLYMRMLERSFRSLKQFKNAILSVQKYLTLAEDSDHRGHRQLIATSLLAELYELDGDPATASKVKEKYYDNSVHAFLKTTRYIPTEIPKLEGWGTDDFTYFFNEAQYNLIATYSSRPETVRSLQEVNARFCVGRESALLFFLNLLTTDDGSVNLNTVQLPDEHKLELYFFMSSHRAFLSAARLAMSAQTVDSYALMRSSLENAAYCFHVQHQPAHRSYWLDRTLSDIARRQRASVFNAKVIFRDEVKKLDSVLAVRAAELYDMCIDKGAHPNVAALDATFTQSNKPGEFAAGVVYLDKDNIDPCLNELVEVAETVLAIFKCAFRSWIW